MPKLKSIDDLLSRALKTLKRFPMSMVCAIAATILLLRYLDTPQMNSQVAYLILSVLLGIPLFLSFALFLETKHLKAVGVRLATWALGLVLLFGVYSYFSGASTDNDPLKYFQISLCVHLLVSFVVYIGREADLGFWQLNKNIFIRILFSGFYAVVLFGGIALAIAAVQSLFDLEFPEIIFGNVATITMVLFQTWHFLSGLPENLDELNQDYSYPKELRIFIQYVTIPLVSLYMVILYCYMLKILINWRLPEGYVGWLVSVMSVIGVINLLLIDPEKNKTENRWIAGYSKYYYILIIPLLLMLFAAVWIRVENYGITEKRYFLIVLGLWLLCISLYFIFSKRKSIKRVPVSLFFVALFSLWGPWGAYSVSHRSQLHELKNLLESNKLLVEGKVIRAKIPSGPAVSADERRKLSNVLDYLIQSHKADGLEQWFGEDRIKSLEISSAENSQAEHKRSTSLMNSMGMNYEGRNYSDSGSYNIAFEERPHAIGDYEHVMHIDRNQFEIAKEYELPEGNLSFKANAEGSVIEIKQSEKVVGQLDLQDIGGFRSKRLTKEDPHPTIKTSAGSYDLELRLERMYVEVNGENSRLKSWGGFLFIKKK